MLPLAHALVLATRAITQRMPKRFRNTHTNPRGNGDLLLVDEDGLFIGSVKAGQLELCCLETGKSYQIASCMDFKKQ